MGVVAMDAADGCRRAQSVQAVQLRPAAHAQGVVKGDDALSACGRCDERRGLVVEVVDEAERGGASFGAMGLLVEEARTARRRALTQLEPFAGERRAKLPPVAHCDNGRRVAVFEVAGIGHADVSPCSLPRTRTRAVVQRHLEA